MLICHALTHTKPNAQNATNSTPQEYTAEENSSAKHAKLSTKQNGRALSPSYRVRARRQNDTRRKKTAIIDEMTENIRIYTKWINEYKAKIEAAKYILECINKK